MGKKINGYENPVAPSIVFPVIPGITAIHVSASVNKVSIPATASQSNIPAFERKPITNATKKIITTVSMLDTSEVNT